MTMLDDYFPALLTKPSSQSIEKLRKRLSFWFSVDKYMSFYARLLAIEFLRLMKTRVSYGVLSQLTGIPESVLCRYVRGSIIPSFEQAINILANLSQSISINELIKKFLERERTTIIDLSRLLNDPYLLRLLSFILLLELTGKKIDKILVGRPGVLPLATTIALELNSKIVLAKNRKYPGVEYYEESIIRSMREVEILYVDKDLLSKRDNVLIMTDVVITGKTLRGLINIAERAKAEIVDIVTVIAIGNEWKKRVGRKIKMLSYLEKPFF